MVAVENACADYAEDLSALLDDELSPERSREVRAHLEGCAACAEASAAFACVNQWIASAPGA